MTLKHILLIALFTLITTPAHATKITKYECPHGGTLDVLTLTCVGACAPGETYNSDAKTCEAPATCTTGVMGEDGLCHKSADAPIAPTWQKCADEWVNQVAGGTYDTCSFTGTQEVRFVSNENPALYTSKTLTNGTVCSPGVFGDPHWMAQKHCEILKSHAGTGAGDANGSVPVSPFPLCEQGTFEDNPSGFDVCWTPELAACPADMTPSVDASGRQICTAGTKTTCPTGTVLGPSRAPGQLGKCEAVPVCSGGGVYDATRHGCFEGYSCPLSGKKCLGIAIQVDANGGTNHACAPGSQLDLATNKCIAPNNCCAGESINDATGKCANNSNILLAEVAPACCPAGTFKNENGACESEEKFCSPHDCTTDLADMMKQTDTPEGANDPKNDGKWTAEGSCTGTLYIFPAKDSRCTKYDDRDMIAAASKMVVMVVMTVVSMGAAAAIVGPMAAGMGVSMNVAQAVYAAATSLAISTSNMSIDAINGKEPTAMSAGMAVASAVVAGAMSYAGSMIGDIKAAETGGTFGTSAINQSRTVLTESQFIEKMSSLGEAGLSNVTRVGGGGVVDIALNRGTTILQTGGVGGVWSEAITIAADGTATLVNTTANLAPTVGEKLMNFAAQNSDMLMKGASVAADIGSVAFMGLGSTKCCYPDKASPKCDKASMEMWPKVKNNLCHKVGNYCATHFLGCVQEKETHCCFETKLSRIFHEQGRPQLKSFTTPDGSVNWGSPEAPNCRGFTVDEFQALNFENIDMSEFVADVEDRFAKMSDTIKTTMQNIATDVGAKALQTPGYKTSFGDTNTNTNVKSDAEIKAESATQQQRQLQNQQQSVTPADNPAGMTAAEQKLSNIIGKDLGGGAAQQIAVDKDGNTTGTTDAINLWSDRLGQTLTKAPSFNYGIDMTTKMPRVMIPATHTLYNAVSSCVASGNIYDSANNICAPYNRVATFL